MTKTEAYKFRDSIIDECKKKGIWHEVTESNRPKLGKVDIIIKIPLKVDSDK